MTIKQIKSFTLDCTGNVCVGDEILFTETIWGGSYRRPYEIGTRRIAAVVVSDSYGAAKQQHTFALKVLGSDGDQPIRRGTTIRRKARNVYRENTLRRPRDVGERDAALAEKYERGDVARTARAFRKDCLI